MDRRQAHRLLIAAALPWAIAVGACGQGAAPPPSASRQTPSPSVAPSEPNVVVSARYGYRLRYPDGWTVSETPGSGGVHPDEPGVDTYRDTHGHILSVVGEVVSGNLTGWTCAFGRHLTRDHGLTAEDTENTTVAGQPARITQYHLEIKPYVTHYIDVELVNAGRGLALSLESTTRDDAADLALLSTITASLTLLE